MPGLSINKVDAQGIRPKEIAIIVGLLLAAVLVSYSAQAWLLVFAGILFGTFLANLASLINRKSPLGYGLSLVIVVLIIVSAALGLLAYSGAMLSNQLSSLADELRQVVTRLEENMPWLKSELWGGGKELLSSTTGSGVLGLASAALTSGAGLIASVFIVFFSGVYLAADAKRYRSAFKRYIPEKNWSLVNEIFNKLSSTLWSWLLGRLFSMCVIGFGSWLILFTLGIPSSGTLAVITGLLTFIPNIGPVLAVAPPALLALNIGPETAGMVILSYSVLQLVESYVLMPLVTAHQVDIPPLVGLTAQLVFGLLFGILGVALAVPFVAAGGVVLDAILLPQTEE